MSKLKVNEIVNLDGEDFLTKGSVARSLNVADEAVINGVAGEVITAAAKYLYNPDDQTTWTIPAGVGAGEVIQSVVGSTLNTTIGESYALELIGDDRTELLLRNFAPVNHVYNLDDTDILIEMVAAMRSGYVMNLQGEDLKIVHKGTNFNNIRPTQDANQTCYMLFEKLDNIEIKNGAITSDLDMEFDSLVLMQFAGCKSVTLRKVSLELNATGVPFYSVNLLETFAGLLQYKHHYDDTEASDLIINDNCKFKVFHPSGGSIGTKDGNPVHDYSGKLVGVEFYGNVSENDQPTPNKPIFGFTLKDSFFTNCTARTVWCWGAYNVRIIDNAFVNIGLDATAFANYVIRMTHWGVDTVISGNRIKNGWFGTCGILTSNNNSPRTPENVNIFDNHFKNSTGICILANAGINTSIKDNKFESCVATGQIIACFDQTSSVYNNFVIEGNQLTDCIAAQALYSSIGEAYKITFKNNKVNGHDGQAVQLKFAPQDVIGNEFEGVTGIGVYLYSALSDIANIINNTFRNGGDYAVSGFANSNANIIKNKVFESEKGLRVSEDSIATGNHIEGTKTLSLDMRRNSKAFNNVVVATANSTAGVDAITNTDATFCTVVGNNIISNGNFRYGINSQPGIDSSIIRNHFSGVFSASEILSNVGDVVLYNTNDSGDVS